MNKQTIAFYNHFSFLYPVIDLILKPQKTLLFHEVNKLPKGKLLDIGVGNGRHLSQYKKHKVVGIDTSVAMLNIARKNRSENIELIEMSGEALSFEDQLFDYVVLSHVIAVVDDANQLLQEVHRVLKPHGQLFILNHFTPDNWLKHVDRSFELIAKSLRFRSVFRLGDLPAIESFILKKEVSVGMASYFRLFIYQK
jgi:phosphatidylethanolamine/phosphatidyl-N-methylethanolamine N-methyltransferase